jgi:diguanylate cyclase (GGDEF)-like protein
MSLHVWKRSPSPGGGMLEPSGGSRKSGVGGWAIAAAVLAACGIATSVAASAAVVRNEANEYRQTFARSSAQVTSTLKLAIERQNDLLSAAGGFLATNPNASDAQFDAWVQAIQAFEHYPELQTLATVVVVPAEELASHLAAAGAQSATVTPPGPRPFYCLSDRIQARSAAAVLAPAGFDFCASPVGPGLLAARDSGLGTYAPYKSGTDTWLGSQTPVYSGGIVPPTVVERRAAFLGWIGTEFAPNGVLAMALHGHPEMAAAMRFQQGSSDVTFQVGVAPKSSQTVVSSLGGGWTVSTFGPPSGGGMLRSGPAAAVLIAGVVLSCLLALLMFVLATGRARAVRMVGARTNELHHQALHDALTGLPNRALIMDRAEQLLARNRRHNTEGAAMFVDLDDFKNVNDTLGHDAGDQLLISVAARLKSTLRNADTIGRMGGDEFVVLIDDTTFDVAPELVAERLLDVMRQPFDLAASAVPLMVHISIGIAVGDRDSAGELLRDADVALYVAKGAGKNCYELFEPEMQSRISRRIDLEFDLRAAIAAGQFRLVYQPIYTLDDLAMIGVEALLRWDHPTRGLVAPDEFIPVLERTGDIIAVGRWVLREACEQMAIWHSRGLHLDISVNVSGRQLDRDVVVDDVKAALTASGLDPHSLILEITETALMGNAAETARRLAALKELGVRVAVDDFGTGYSSLAYLRQFPVDSLKIDRQFTSEMETSPEVRALVGTVVQLSEDLGLSTLAEGVETTEEIDLLRGEHVQQAQGFLLSKPLDPAALETQVLEPLGHTSVQQKNS